MALTREQIALIYDSTAAELGRTDATWLAVNDRKRRYALLVAAIAEQARGLAWDEGIEDTAPRVAAAAVDAAFRLGLTRTRWVDAEDAGERAEEAVARQWIRFADRVLSHLLDVEPTPLAALEG